MGDGASTCEQPLETLLEKLDPSSSDLAREALGWILPERCPAGVGMATAQLTNVILVDVPVAQSGQASGLQSTVRQLGSALGVAVLGTLLVSTLGAATADNLSSVPGLNDPAQKQVVSIVKGSAGTAIPEIGRMPGGQPAQAAAESAMVTAARITTLSAAGIILLGLLATIALPPMKPQDEEGVVQADSSPEAVLE
jgi:hypothetical protein